jgi:amidase
LYRTPGASSSGSAAAVADFQVPLALGTQTAASVVRPAAYCGIYGYKPTWGDISYGGVKFSSPTLDTVGILARSIDDIALFRSVLAEIQFSGVWSRLLPRPRIGVCRTAFWWSCEAEVRSVFENAIQQLENAGAELSPLDLPNRFNEIPMAARWIANREGAMGLAPERMNRYEMISKGLRADRIDDGMAVSYERYRAAIELMDRCRLELDDIFCDLDVILTPVTTNDAPVGLNYTGNPVFGTLWTGLHVPCLTVPGWKSTSGMPIGLQLVGRRGNDLRLLQTAKWMEERIGLAKS